MNMQTSGSPILRMLSIPAILCVMMLSSCAEEYYVYGVDDVEITPVNSTKDKPKTHAQYISILYANMFQKAIGPNQMLQALNAIESIGDKQVAYDMLVSKYMNDPEVKIPTVESMRADPETFVRETYKRFLVRQPTEAELQWMINYIDSRPAVTPELIFFSFATSNEHAHY
ncbi:MAG: hypothetical protein IPL92_19100 [Saprospiraceae bacterium]|nr:hypothetical protein [Candidatus Opimibacter iunctus]